MLAHDLIKTVLFETPMLIAMMLILGGFVLLWVDRRPERPTYRDVMDFPLPMTLKIGLFQCLATGARGSRGSGATIVGALLLGADALDVALDGDYDVAFYLAGADPWEGDRLGRLSLTKPGLRARDSASSCAVCEAFRRSSCSPAGTRRTRRTPWTSTPRPWTACSPGRPKLRASRGRSDNGSTRPLQGLGRGSIPLAST